MSVKVIFGYDISCPWAYIASTRIRAYARSEGFEKTLEYQPILLGGIYDAIGAKQGKGGSASDVMPPNKKAYEAVDLERTAKRWNVPVAFHPRHPMRTVAALRLLHSLGQKERILLTDRLYKAYWVDHLDLDQAQTLCALHEQVLGRHLSLEQLDRIASQQRDVLRKWTDGFIKAGCIGVPCFWVGTVDTDVDFSSGQIYWGGDRFHFVASEAKKLMGIQDWLTTPPRTMHASHPVTRKVNFYFDFSSPWTYLGWTQHRNAIAELENVSVEWTYIPTVLGIVFKEIGTPIVPSLSVTPAKRELSAKDMQRWVEYWNAKAKKHGYEPVGFEFSKHFPLRTPAALRVALAAHKLGAEDEFRVIDAIFKGAWAQNKDISKPEVLHEICTSVLGKAKADQVTADAETDETKTKLRKNTADAIEAGIIGFPSFQVIDAEAKSSKDKFSQIVWGQDRLDVLQDILSGWKSYSSSSAL